MDTCCLNRPFDDQTIDRNRLESEAVLTILRHVHSGDWELIGSGVNKLESDRSPDPQKRKLVEGFLSLCTIWLQAHEPEVQRWEELKAQGFCNPDAMHIACAESGKVDVLLTTDDPMLKLARKHGDKIRVRVENPLTWIREQIEHDSE